MIFSFYQTVARSTNAAGFKNSQSCS